MTRLGVDFGGTKIEIAALGDDGRVVARRRLPNPGDYEAALAIVKELVAWADAEAGTSRAPVGVALPGSMSPVDRRLRNANSTWLNGRAFDTDLEPRWGNLCGQRTMPTASPCRRRATGPARGARWCSKSSSAPAAAAAW